MRAHYHTENSLTLFTEIGERKYLSQLERKRFYAALDILDAEERTFCEMVFWTGMRPSEARALTRQSISIEGHYVVIRSLKKRDNRRKHFRIVPLPRQFIEKLSSTHNLDSQSCKLDERLWPIGRTTGWKYIRSVMNAAHIHGTRACARGLRHGFGVHAALCHVPETRIQKYLGHTNLSTTAVYLDMAGFEDREMARRMWVDLPVQ